MRKCTALPALSLLLALLTPCRAFGAPAAADGEPPRLSFRADGTFTVLVLADTQDTQLPVPYLISGIETALDAQTPDLVILLGDQLEGMSPLVHIGNPEKNVASAIGQLLAPIVSRGIPFAVVFGNHDAESGVSNEAQLALYQSYPGCVSQHVEANGAHRIPVFSHAGSAALQLYLFDSGTYTEDGGYGCVSREQVDWYIAESDALRAENGGQITPAAAFQHIVVGEVYDALTQVSAGMPDAVAGVGTGKDRFFSTRSPAILSGALREAPCPSSENYGQFDAFLAQGDVFALFCGHDHVNDYLISHRGIDLVACPGATYTSYNSREARGIRLLRFSEENVRNYETMLLPFSSLETVTLPGVIPYFLLVTGAIPNLAKTGAALLLLCGALALCIVLCVRKPRRPKRETPDQPPEFDE